MGLTIHGALRWWAREMGDQPALVIDSEAISFRDLEGWSLRVGDALRRDGVELGDRVAIIGENSPEYCALALGIIQAGAIGVPLSVRLTPREIAEMIGATEPKLIVCEEAYVERVAAAVTGADSTRIRRLTCVDALRAGDARPERSADIATDRPVLIMSTSGSTGAPKATIHTHKAIMMCALEFALVENNCARGARLLVVGPMSSASGYFLLLWYLGQGSTVYMERKFDAARALRVLVDERINGFAGVPIFFERIAALTEFAVASFPDLRYAHAAGSSVSLSLMSRWREKGVVLRQAYGQTEAIGAWAAPTRTALESPEKCGPGSIFTEFAIFKDGSLAPPGETGEIVIRGPSQMPGYWRNDDETKKALVGGWLHTGDLGRIDEDGNITFVDRIKDLIISGGLNISAAEVERVIGEIDAVEEVAVIAARDDRFGETPLAIVYANAPLDVPAVIKHCDARLANYKVPRYVVLAGEPLPRLPSGKIAKPALRKQFKDAADTLQKVR